MIRKAVILLGLALGCHAAIVAHSEQRIRQGFHSAHNGLRHIGSHKPEHHEEYAWAYPSYEFSYSVNDPHTHDHKGQYEKRHGDEVTGEYWLLQPDGKKRTVKYQANKHEGFTAHVHYTDHHHHHHEEPHREEPRHEEIIKPVEEIFVEREPSREAEVPEKIEEEVNGEQREAQREEEPKKQLEEHREEVQEEKHEEKHVEHKTREPIHVEYYIQHKYHKKHHDEHEKKPEPKEEKHEEHHERIYHHIPIIPLEIYSKVHHPIHNEHHGHVHHEPVHHHSVEHKEHGLNGREENHGNEEHKPVHHPQIRYRPLINYNREHHKAQEHKSPLVRLTLIDNEKKEHHSEELSPIRVSEVHAERKHYVENPPHMPLLRLQKPMIHRQHTTVIHNQHNPHYQENHRRH